MTRIILLLAACLSVFSLSCSSGESDTPPIVGYWKMEGAETYLVFLLDGTYCTGGMIGTRVGLTGTYSCSGDQCVLDTDGEAIKFAIDSSAENRLCLEAKGEIDCYVRISRDEFAWDCP